MHHHTPLACRGTCIFVSKWAQRLRQAAGGCIITTPPPPQHFLSPIWCVPTPVTVRAPTLCVRLSMPPRRPSQSRASRTARRASLSSSGLSTCTARTQKRRTHTNDGGTGTEQSNYRPAASGAQKREKLQSEVESKENEKKRKKKR